MLTAGRLKRIKSYISPSNGNQSTSILNKFCCELVDEVERLKRLTEIKDRNSLARNLCPDHRDKQQGKPCLACEVERRDKALQKIAVEVPRAALAALDAAGVKAEEVDGGSH